MKTPYDIILQPVVTEKSMDDAAQKKYTFKVAKTANKTEIKNAVEAAFGVTVEKVNTALRRKAQETGQDPGHDTFLQEGNRKAHRVQQGHRVLRRNITGGKAWESRNIIRPHLVFAA